MKNFDWIKIISIITVAILTIGLIYCVIVGITDPAPIGEKIAGFILCGLVAILIAVFVYYITD